MRFALVALTAMAVTFCGGDGAKAPADAPVPVAVAEALAGALREALANVRRHAGVTKVEVTLCRRPDGGGQIAVTDRGIGFSPAQVSAARLGIARSIRERLADVEGSAAITSAPGRGTRVELSLLVPRGVLGCRRPWIGLGWRRAEGVEMLAHH